MKWENISQTKYQLVVTSHVSLDEIYECGKGKQAQGNSERANHSTNSSLAVNKQGLVDAFPVDPRSWWKR